MLHNYNIHITIIFKLFTHIVNERNANMNHVTNKLQSIIISLIMALSVIPSQVNAETKTWYYSDQDFFFDVPVLNEPKNVYNSATYYTDGYFNGTYRLKVEYDNGFEFSSFGFGLTANFYGQASEEIEIVASPGFQIKAIYCRWGGKTKPGTITNETKCKVTFWLQKKDKIAGIWWNIGGQQTSYIKLHYTPKPQPKLENPIIVNNPLSGNTQNIIGGAICAKDINTNDAFTPQSSRKPDALILNLEKINGNTSRLNYNYGWDLDSISKPKNYSPKATKDIQLNSKLFNASSFNINFKQTDKISKDDLMLVNIVQNGNDIGIRYSIGWDLDKNGNPSGWSGMFSVGADNLPAKPIGVACLLTDLDNNKRADAYFVVAYRQITGILLKTRLSRNLSIDGSNSQSNTLVLPDYLIPDLQIGGTIKDLGIGITKLNIDNNNKQEIAIACGYDSTTIKDDSKNSKHYIKYVVFWDADENLFNTNFSANIFYTDYYDMINNGPFHQMKPRLFGFGMDVVDFDKDNLSEVLILDHNPEGKSRLWPIHLHELKK